MTLKEQILEANNIYFLAISPNKDVFSIKVSHEQAIQSIPYGTLIQQTNQLEKEKTIATDIHDDPTDLGKKRLLIQINDF